MNSSELGHRIKEARLSKKMTQSEVVGTFITRNMLSQIESGSANPSVKTLQYLAKVLDIPINQLLPNPDMHSELSVRDKYLDGKAHLISKDYTFAINTFEELLIENSPMYDEISALLAKCYYEYARELYSSDSINVNNSDTCSTFNVVISYLKKSVSLSSKGLFSNRELKTSSLMLLDSLLEAQYNGKI